MNKAKLDVLIVEVGLPTLVSIVQGLTDMNRYISNLHAHLNKIIASLENRSFGTCLGCKVQ